MPSDDIKEGKIKKGGINYIYQIKERSDPPAPQKPKESWLSIPISLSLPGPDLSKEEGAHRRRLLSGGPIDPDDYEDLKDDYETQESKS